MDAHCHVFGPGDEFPYAPERKYTPADASKHQLFALRDRLGFDKNVIVQATCHGTDNRALVDALRASNGRARGIATVDRASPTPSCARLHEAGVRGTRFNFVKRLVDFTPREVLSEIAQRIAPLGWHVVIYFEAADLPELWDFFTSLPTTVVVDHMGRPDVTKPVDGPEFELFVRMMREHENIWSKVSCPERLTVTGPPALNGERNAYRDVVPFAKRLVETFPDRVLWGTDWPHPESQGPHAGRWPAGGLRAAHRHDAGAAAEAARRQPHAAVLELKVRIECVVQTTNDRLEYDEDLPGGHRGHGRDSREGPGEDRRRRDRVDCRAHRRERERVRGRSAIFPSPPPISRPASTARASTR